MATQAPTTVQGPYTHAYRNLPDLWLPRHDGFAVPGATGAANTSSR